MIKIIGGSGFIGTRLSKRLILNKKEFDRYTNATKEGIYSIYNLEYTYEEGTNTYHINNFDTQYKEDVTAIKEHDLHKGTKPFHHNKGRGAAMSMLL